MAASLGGAAMVGRNVVNRQIEARLPAEIETARHVAIVELDKRINQVVVERLVSLGLNLLIKTGLVGAVYLLFAQGHLTATGLKIVVAVMIAGFVLRDLSKTLPYLAPALRLMRRHRMDPRRIAKELVAGIAFERAYAETMIAMESGPNRLWLALSKYTAKSISSDVAAAVADVARTTSFRRAKGRIIMALITAVAMLAAYAAFFILTIGHA